MNPILVKRLKSLTWRAGMMLAALVVSFALENLSLLSFSEEVTVILGLVLGEVSKHLNNQTGLIEAEYDGDLNL